MAEKTKQSTKVRALKQHGGLNPKPETVCDERFLGNAFFDPHDLVQVKYEMVRRVRMEGEAVSKAAADFGLSRPTFYQSDRALKREGLAGLVPKRPGPKTAHKLTEPVMAAVERFQAETPDVGSQALSTFVLERFGIQVHPRSIERALLRRKKKRQAKR